MEIDLLDAPLADLEELADLERLSFRDSAGTGPLNELLGTLLSADHYQKKYLTPAGLAKLVTIRENGRLVAVNAMIPEVLRHEGGTTLGWQSCDTATHPDARGRGLFKKCVNTLHESLRDGEVFFGYPNANSTQGFVRCGWTTFDVLDAYAAPLPVLFVEQGIEQITHFDEQFDAFAIRIVRPGIVGIERSAAYLNWRYFSRGASPYSAFRFLRDGRLLGFSVMRSLPWRAGNACVILELFGDSSAVEGALLHAMIRWAMQMRCWPTLFFSTAWGAQTWLRHGFVRIPRRFSPRQLVLMGVGIGPAGARLVKQKWHAHVGDWDVF